MDEQTFQILQSAIEESDSNIYENIPQIEMETGSTIDVVKESYSNPSAPNLTIPNGQVVGSSFSSQNRDIQQCIDKICDSLLQWDAQLYFECIHMGKYYESRDILQDCNLKYSFSTIGPIVSSYY